MSSFLPELANSAAPSGGTPNSPDSPRAAAALSTAIVALHAFLRVEKDPQDRAAATQCLAKLESMRGKKIPGGNMATSSSPGPTGGNSGY